MNCEIPIFFTIDDRYSPFLAVALNSAVKNSSRERRYRAIILHQGISERNAAKLTAFETDNFKIDLVPMKANLDALDDRISNRLRGDNFTLTIYFRLFIHAMFPQYDKGIYVDSDVVFTDDIARLYDTDIGDNMIGACRDMSIADVPSLIDYTVNAVGAERGEYINSGVLLLNLKKLREVEFDRHFIDLLSRYHFDSVAPDQDYINAMCKGRIYYLDPEWDAMPNEARPQLKKTSIVHYNLFSKPWCYDGVQYEELFWHYAEHSGYIKELRAIKDSFDEEKRRFDADSLSTLLRRGVEIPEQDVTFKKMYDMGVRIRV